MGFPWTIACNNCGKMLWWEGESGISATALANAMGIEPTPIPLYISEEEYDAPRIDDRPPGIPQNKKIYCRKCARGRGIRNKTYAQKYRITKSLISKKLSEITTSAPQDDCSSIISLFSEMWKKAQRLSCLELIFEQRDETTIRVAVHLQTCRACKRKWGRFQRQQEEKEIESMAREIILRHREPQGQ